MLFYYWKWVKKLRNNLIYILQSLLKMCITNDRRKTRTRNQKFTGVHIITALDIGLAINHLTFIILATNDYTLNEGYSWLRSCTFKFKIQFKAPSCSQLQALSCIKVRPSLSCIPILKLFEGSQWPIWIKSVSRMSTDSSVKPCEILSDVIDRRFLICKWSQVYSG